MEGLFALASVVLVVFAIIMYFVPLRLWVAAFSSGAYVRIGTLVAMRLRRVPPSRIVGPRISAVKAGLEVSVDELEAHYLAGGDVERVVKALISADEANIELTSSRAAAIDLEAEAQVPLAMAGAFRHGNLGARPRPLSGGWEVPARGGERASDASRGVAADAVFFIEAGRVEQ